MLDHVVILFLIFCGISILFSMTAASVCISTTVHQGSLVFITWPALISCLLRVLLVSYQGGDLDIGDLSSREDSLL